MRRLVVLVILTLFCTALVLNLSPRRIPPNGNPAALILVAQETIPAGTPGRTIITQGLAVLVAMPKKLVLPGALGAEKDILSRVVRVSIQKGSQLTLSDFTAD
ncbi:MAG: hypothetical protein ACXVQY_10160 [Actinomycetota bacterium]